MLERFLGFGYLVTAGHPAPQRHFARFVNSGSVSPSGS